MGRTAFIAIVIGCARGCNRQAVNREAEKVQCSKSPVLSAKQVEALGSEDLEKLDAFALMAATARR